MKALSDRARVFMIENFLSNDEIEHLIAVAAPKMTRSMVIEPVTGQGKQSDYRTGMTGMLARGQDLIIKEIESRIASVARVRTQQLEFLNVNRYDVGDEFKPHTDWFAPNAPQLAPQLKFGGQRIASMLVYLNEPEEGGETTFDELGLKVKPVKGAALFWHNVKESGEPDPLTLHCGKPVLKGSKIALTCWIRERAFDGTEEEAFANQKKAAKEAEKFVAEDEATLRKRIEELQKENILMGQAEILTICKQRKLVLVPKAQIMTDGRIGAICDLEVDESAK